MLDRLLKFPDRTIFFALTLISFCIYLYSLAPGIAGYGDSGEIITTGYLLGVPHPSGYPLITFLIYLISKLPLDVNVAYKAHLLAGILHALTIGVLYFVNKEFITQVFPRSQQHSAKLRLASIIASLFLAFNTLFWLYASIIEVNALNSITAALLFYAGLRWRRSLLESETHSTRWLIAVLILIGLGLSNVQTYILLLPGMLFLLIYTLYQTQMWSTYKSPKLLATIILLPILSYFIINLPLFWLNQNHADFSWYFPQTFSGWWRMLLRSDYSGYLPEQERQLNSYFSSKDLKHYLTGASAYIGYLIQHFTATGGILGAISMYYITYKRKTLGYFPIILWGISGLWFASYMSIPPDGMANLEFRSSMGITHRQYILGYITWTMLISLGVYITQIILLNKHKLIAKIALVVIILSIPYELYTNAQVGVQRHNTFSYDHSKEMLDSAEPNSVIICLSDISCFPLMYMQLVENYRPDVTVLIKNEKYQTYFLQKHPDYIGYPYPFNPEFTAEIVTWNATTRPTYLAEPNGFYISYIGLEGSPFYLIPQGGYLLKVVTRVPDQLPEPDFQLTEDIIAQNISPKDLFRAGEQDYLAHKHTLLGVLYGKLGLKDLARKNYEYAISLNPEFAEPRQFLGQLDAYAGDPEYTLGSTSPSAEELFEIYQQQYQQSEEEQDDELLNQAYETLIKARFRDPRNPQIRFELAQLYLQNQFYAPAKRELEFLTQQFSDDQEYQQLLETIPLE